MLLVAAALVFHLELVRHSLTGTHYRFRQFVDDQPIAGAEVNVTVRPDGTTETTENIVSAPPRALAHPVAGLAIVNVNGVARYARQTFDGRVARFLDAETGALIREEPRYAGAKPARVFDPNPIEKLNDPNLQDQNNSASAVPDSAYSIVELDDVNPSGPLGGPYVQIVDVDLPAIAPIDASQSLILDRSETGFDDVNAYFHIDRSQRYVQSLGYAGPRGIAQYPVPVDTHALDGADNSLFIPSQLQPGRGTLLFGDGGTDDAEDANLLVHEYAHALHEWISPGTFLGQFNSEGRAMSEGFADYWSFSASYAPSVASGRDPFCLADWDARCWLDAASERCGYPVGADCLRRLDSPKTVADFVPSNSPGTEHLNGEIWSSALREIFVAMTQRYGADAGRRTADTIVIESLFGAPPNPGFAGIARKMIAADRYLNSGANADLICAAMASRGILSGCAVLPRGELTLFQSSERGVPIPDNDPNGVTLHAFVSDARAIERIAVQVDIQHTNRGDLKIVLIAPDGTEVVLQNPSNDHAHDIHAIFGRDANPAESLDVLRGRPAAGEWRLHVSDVLPRDTGTVLSWSLVVQFVGETPGAPARPTASSRQTIPVAGRIHGANGTFFTTDVRLLNRGARDTIATLIFTPDGADGRTEFTAVNVNVPEGNVVALNDVIGDTFGTEGIGQLEVDGDVIATSRTYTRNASGGTLGEFIPPVPAPGATSTVFLLRVLNNGIFRSNVGVAELAGNDGHVRVTFYDAATGSQIAESTQPIQPFGHIQLAATAGTAMTATITVIDGNARIAGYASIIDNRTGDASFVSGDSGDGVRDLMAPAISASGALGTDWSTDLWLARIDAANATHPITVTYSDRATSRTKSVSATLPARSSRAFPDVVRLSFNALGTAGIMSATLEDGAVGAAVIANSTLTGTFAQSVRFLQPSSGPQLDLPYVESSDEFRTNIGLMSDFPSAVRVTLFSAAGDVLDTAVRTLSPFRLDQFQIRQTVVNGHARIEVLSGRVAAYASVVDNITGDASFVPAQ
ncbi:MAG TPA: proprotein convertase P-domain-containing protein [Thermoanaerobaculia bacterium]